MATKKPEVKKEAAIDVIEVTRGQLDMYVQAHDCYDDETAELLSWFEVEWRVEQARRLIRSITVLVSTETSTLAVVAYVRHPDMSVGEQGYTSTMRVRSDRDRAHEVLTDEFARAAAALRRARELAIVFGMQKDVDVLAKRVEKLQKRVPSSSRANA